MPTWARTDSKAQARDRALERGDHYVTRVNKNRLDMERFTDDLNQWWDAGFRLAHVFEQQGNTVMVFERRNDQPA